MYINCGDVNFFEGGCLVEQSDWDADVYAVITCDQVPASEDEYVFHDMQIDVSDDWIDRAAVESFAGVADDDLHYAIDVLSYYGPHEFGSDGEFLTRTEVVKRMDDIAATSSEFETQPWHYED